MSSSSFSPSEEQLWSPLRVFLSSIRVLLTKEYHILKWWICHAPPYPRKVQGNHCFGSCSWLFPQIPHLKTTFIICEAELSPLECVLCFLPIHSGHHVRWAYQPGSHRRKVTQEEGHTGILIHLLSVVRAFIFLARRIQPFLSLVDHEVEFCVHPLGFFICFLFVCFFVRKFACRDRTHVPTCQKVTRLPLSYRGDRLSRVSSIKKTYVLYMLLLLL